jgi:hypothetical protein
VSPLRRLTRAEYDGSVRELFGDVGKISEGFLPDAQVGPFQAVSPFPSNAGVAVTETQLDKYVASANNVADIVAADPAKLPACAAQAPVSEQCVRDFISDVGGRAFRRPLQAAEIDSYAALYAIGAEGGTSSEGFRLVISTLLQSPNFLYHVEQPAGQGLATLNAHELAARLSYYLTSAPPDAELRQLAGSDQLGAQLKAQARRLLATPAAREVLGRVAQQWLGVERVEEIVKESAAVPEYTADLAAAMRREVTGFVGHVLFEGDRTLGTLLTGSFASEPALNAFYGLAPNSAAVPNRFGILTLPAVMTVYSHNDQTSPIKRGKFVRNRLLCEELPVPPPGVDTTPPAVDPSLSTRDRFAAHRDEPTCNACHQLIDPLGLGFEAYDMIGRYRTQDGNFAVADSGELVGSPASIAGPFKGASELASKLLASPEARACVAQYWTYSALGRALDERDTCWMERVTATLEATGGDLQEMILAIVDSPAFRSRRAQ